MTERSTTVQELGMTNPVNLCESCHFQQPTCDSEDMIFGDAPGNDDVVACSCFSPVQTRKEYYGT